MRVYLDNCCYNRPFDEQTQLKVRLETEAKLRVQMVLCYHCRIENDLCGLKET